MNTAHKQVFQPARIQPFVLILLLCWHGGGAAAVTVTNIPTGELKRYVAFTESQRAAAVAQGATVVLETRGLTAVVCTPTLAKTLGLTEDIRLQAVDTKINTQILATRLQQMGVTGRGRRIVVLDTGYNYKHPELASSYLGGRDFVNHDDDPMDDNGHGSHVAGIITADGIDPLARGVAPDTGIVSGKVLDAYGFGFTSDLVKAIYWAVDGPDGIFGDYDDFRPDAINISIGSEASDLYPNGSCDTLMPPLTYAIKYAVDHGIPVVVAAGNNGSAGVSFPGCISYATTVGAVDGSNVLASFSGIGPAVSLVAPGVGVYSAFLGNDYAVKDGTSHAAPVVSGTIALLKEAFPNASLPNIQNALQTTAADLGTVGRDNRYGCGLVQASRALGVLTTNLVNVVLSLSHSNNQVVISWPATPPGFVLQVSDCPDPPTNGWRTLTNPIVTVGNRNVTSLPNPARLQFYRLNWR